MLPNPKPLAPKTCSEPSSEPMGIMHFCLSHSWGGLEMYPPRVCRALELSGQHVHAVALRGSPVAKAFGEAGIALLEFDSALKAVLSIRSLLQYIRRHDIRILHANKSGDMRLGALLVQFAPNLRLFFTDHMGVTKPKKDLYHRWAYSKVQRLFSISKATYERNLNAFPLSSSRIEQLYYGMNFSLFREPMSQVQRLDTRRSLGMDGDEGVLIALPGRLSPGKGHEVWVRSLGQLTHLPTKQPWHAVIIGDATGEDAQPGGYGDRIKALVNDLNLDGRVTFAGFRKDIHRCLRAADIAAIPSQNEAFGLSVIESMAAGCAVVGASSGAVPELVGEDRGLLADVSDPIAWAQCFEKLINQPELREQLATQGQRWVFENFTMEQHVDKLMAHYLQALNEC